MIVLLLLLLILSGCQEELVEIDEPSPEEVVTVNSTITQLVLRLVLKDGSNDNIIDRSSCTSVLLPITVIVNRQEVVLNSEEDLGRIEEIFDQSDDDDDFFEVIFPIKVIHSNYSEVEITNKEELDHLQELCEGGVDEDIECLDFAYPIHLSVFDLEKDVAHIVSIDEDKEMFHFFGSLSDGDLVGFEFPIVMISFDSSEIEINDNIELEEAIESSIDACDEEDAIEDDDDVDATIMEIETILVSNDWLITLFTDTADVTIAYNDFIFSFNSEGLIVAEGELGENFEGEWSLGFREDAQFFTLTFDFATENIAFIWLESEWEIITFSESKIEMKAPSENDDFEKRMTLEKI